MLNVRSLYRASSLTALARELARYKLDLEAVQEVRWNKGGTVRAGDCNFFYGWIFRKWEGVVGTGWSWLRIGTGGGHL